MENKILINKWNKEKNKYEPYFVPGEWNVKTFSLDMEEEVNCICCGKKIKYGDSYTSRVFHTEHGIGYSECEKCYYKNI